MTLEPTFNLEKVTKKRNDSVVHKGGLEQLSIGNEPDPQMMKTIQGPKKVEYDWFPCMYKGWVCRDVNHKKKLEPTITKHVQGMYSRKTADSSNRSPFNPNNNRSPAIFGDADSNTTKV